MANRGEGRESRGSEALILAFPPFQTPLVLRTVPPFVTFAYVLRISGHFRRRKNDRKAAIFGGMRTHADRKSNFRGKYLS